MFHIKKPPILYVRFLQKLFIMNILDLIFNRTLFLQSSLVPSPSMLKNANYFKLNSPHNWGGGGENLYDHLVSMMRFFSLIMNKFLI